MKKFLKFAFIGIMFFIWQPTNAQKYSRIFIENNTNIAQTLANTGIPLDDAYITKTGIILELSAKDLEKIRQKNISFSILIDDVTNYYKNRLKENYSLNRTDRTPEHFNLGSMGGELTYEEMLAELSEMHELYPNLITYRCAIDSSNRTHNDSLIYWVKISDNPNIDENEPEVLYTGVHHAREPISMMNLIYYMWYLLENYETDSLAKYLVDNFEQYFVPIVNPDGYKYNQSQEPNGGGM
jgi:hypothetical protein